MLYSDAQELNQKWRQEKTLVPFTLASKNPNLSRIRVFRDLLGNFP